MPRLVKSFQQRPNKKQQNRTKADGSNVLSYMLVIVVEEETTKMISQKKKRARM